MAHGLLVELFMQHVSSHTSIRYVLPAQATNHACLAPAALHRSSIDCFKKIIEEEGTKSLFKGAGANILRAVAGAGALAGYDRLQVMVLGKKYGHGE